MTCNQTSILEMAANLRNEFKTKINDDLYFRMMVYRERFRFKGFLEFLQHNCGGIEFPTSFNILNPFQIKDLLFESAIKREQNIINFLKQEKARSRKHP